MKILTLSGSVYTAEVSKSPKGFTMLAVQKDGMDEPRLVMPIFRDRLPFLLDTVKWSEDRVSGKMIGVNARGIVTCRFDSLKVLPGMILVSPRAQFMSTEIVRIEN